jgi:hypothetical protein
MGAEITWTAQQFIMLFIGWAIGWIIPTPPVIYRWWLGAGERDTTLLCAPLPKESLIAVNPAQWNKTLLDREQLYHFLHAPHMNSLH